MLVYRYWCQPLSEQKAGQQESQLAFTQTAPKLPNTDLSMISFMSTPPRPHFYYDSQRLSFALTPLYRTLQRRKTRQQNFLQNYLVIWTNIISNLEKRDVQCCRRNLNTKDDVGLSEI